MIGRRLGHYEILEKLGSGGMGEVYKARDARLGRFVAIKVLTAETLTDPAPKQRFFQEARAASGLNHPNIVTVHDVGEDGSMDYLVMEYVPGKTLEQAIPRKGLGLGETLNYSIQIADALAAAHAAGIVHRDVKPSNVMITESGRVKVLDFGLAKLAEAGALGEDESTRTAIAHTVEGAVVGSVPYMSPEQAEGKPVDARTDIFSLGAVLYQMCTGQRAFSAESRAGTLAAVIAKEPTPIEQLAPGVPAELERTVLRCLRKDPNKRFQSMLDLKLTLEELKAESDSGRLGLSKTRAAPPARRTRLAAAAAATVLAAAAGLGWVWWIGRDREQKPLSLDRLTFDSGLTTDPAISPDGKLIAYASDRAGEGSMDIWVQYQGGEPVRITHGPADELQPSFSPDGTHVVYRSLESGGRIYMVSSLGGEEPRLVVDGGADRPRFSPDGARILFSSSSQLVRRAYTIDVTVPGAQQKQLAPEFRYVVMPVWSPDGQDIMFGGLRENGDFGVWVIPRDGGTVQAVRLDPSISLLQIRQVTLYGWLPGDRILAEVETRGRAHLWQAKLRRHPWSIGGVEQITFGTGSARSPSVARDGTMVVSSEETDLDLWSLPLDERDGEVKGEPKRLTQDAAREGYPSISVDGTKLAYSAEQADSSNIWVMDLPNGAKRMLTASPELDRRPAISMDGTQVAYMSQATAQSTLSSYVSSFTGGPAKKIDASRVLLWDWSIDGRAILAATARQPFGVDLIEVATGATVPFLKRPHDVYQSHVSHDGRWAIAMESGVGVLIAEVKDGKPPAADAWGPLGLKNVDLIRWSADDGVIYFISNRDSFRCIWAQRVDPRTKRITGEAFPIAHFHQAARSLRMPDSGEIGLAVARDKIVVSEADRMGNIWTTKLPQ